MNRANAAGFTLLELLVALLVFGFLIAGLSQTVRFGMAAWQSEARISRGQGDFEAVDRTLRHLIENMRPSDEGANPSIEGTANTLSGVTVLPAAGPGAAPGPVEAALAVSGNRLVLRWRPYRHAASLRPMPPPREALLMDGVARLTLSYWRPTGGWVTAWREPDLPPLVRLHLTFAGAEQPRWPDIVVAPVLSRP